MNVDSRFRSRSGLASVGAVGQELVQVDIVGSGHGVVQHPSDFGRSLEESRDGRLHWATTRRSDPNPVRTPSLWTQPFFDDSEALTI